MWYELGNTAISGLHNNEMVFAAKAVSDGVTANGGFHWVVVGNAAPGDARHDRHARLRRVRGVRDQ